MRVKLRQFLPTVVPLLSVTIIVTTAQPGYATNPGFFPGDACFVTRLSAKLLDEIDAAESPVFSYALPEWFPGYLCGYSGYWNLEYAAMPKSMKESLRQTYNDVREFQPQRLVVLKDRRSGEVKMTEENPLRVLIVNDDYDEKRYGVVAKFDEDWANEFRSLLGAPNADFRVTYVPLVRDPDVIMAEWRDAIAVKPLRVSLPIELAKTHAGARVTDPIKPKGKLKLIVLTDIFEAYANPVDGAEIYVITEQGKKRLTYSTDKSSWRTDEELQQDEIEKESDDEPEEEGVKSSPASAGQW